MARHAANLVEELVISTRDLFNRHSLRCTRQRVALYEALRQCKSHPTAEELYRMVRQTTDGLSRATVYNTLETFCKAGLARQMPSINGCSRYDADISDHIHIRLAGDEIRDVPADLGQRLMNNLPQDVLAEIEHRLGVRIEGVSVQFIGRHRGHGVSERRSA